MVRNTSRDSDGTNTEQQEHTAAIEAEFLID